MASDLNLVHDSYVGAKKNQSTSSNSENYFITHGRKNHRRKFLKISIFLSDLGIEEPSFLLMDFSSGRNYTQFFSHQQNYLYNIEDEIHNAGHIANSCDVPREYHGERNLLLWLDLVSSWPT